jgi:hypothetical protein
VKSLGARSSATGQPPSSAHWRRRSISKRPALSCSSVPYAPPRAARN